MKIALLDQIGRINNKYSFSLCNELKKHGEEIILITNNKNNVEGCNVICKYLFENYSETKNPFKKCSNYISSWKKVYKFCIQEKLDILHVQWVIFSPVDYYYMNKIKKVGIKIIITIHDILPFNKKFYDFKYHKKIYDLAFHIIVQAQINATKLKSEFNIFDGKVSYIPHGNFIEFAEVCLGIEGRKYLDLPLDKKVILFFGQIKKVKGIGVLIEAFKVIAENREDVILLVAGKVWKDDFEIYLNLIKEYKLEERIRCDIKFIPDEEIKYYFSSADLVVLPYLQVYQSGVIQLAYAYEKAVVATDVGGLPEVVLNNVTGKIVQANNSGELARAILEVLQDNKRNTEMGIRGKKYIEDKFSWGKITQQVKELYESAM